ncbi:MAG TPA: LysE family transporter [Chloroflexia bacterium]|nr:LysE family transporter [Chloroflexia bacterium]
METGLFISGLIIGFSIAAPVGPIGVLCIRRTLSDGRASGLASGLGAATADASYGLVAGLGLTSVSSLLVAQQGWLRLFGGIFLLYLGARIYFSPPSTEAAVGGGKGLLWTYLSTFVLTLSNPTTILSFVAVFAGLGVAVGDGGLEKVPVLVAAVFLGSAAWWLLLVGVVGSLRARLSTEAIIWINRVSGIIIGTFGLVALVSLVV